MSAQEGAHGAHGNQSHVKLYLIIGTCLATLTGMSFFISEGMSNRLATIVLVLGVASIKALLVMTFFMHLKFEGRWKWVIVGLPVVLAVLFLLALMPDIGHGYKGLWGTMTAYPDQPASGAH